MRIKIYVAYITLFLSMFSIMSNGNTAFAESDDEKLDSYYVKQFEKFNKALDRHIRQLDECIAAMEMFEEKDTELVFKDLECSKLHEMRPEAQSLHKGVGAALEEYYRWIDSLTEDAFEEFVKYSISSQSELLASIKKYQTKHKKALVQSERVVQRQVQRLNEMEKTIKETEKKIELNQ